MQTRSGYDYAELAFDRDAAVVERAGYDELLDRLGAGGFDDVVVLAHGWNSDLADARLLYQRLADELRRAAAGVAHRRMALLGLLWPSARFAERDLIPGGAAATGSAVPDHALRAHLAGLHGVFDAPSANAVLDAAATVVPAIEDSARAREEFAGLLRRLLPAPSAEDHDDLPDQLRRLPGRDVLQLLSPPVLPIPYSPVPFGHSVGQAAGLGLPFGGYRAAAQRLLNLVTYYQMKARSGTVGAAAGEVLHGIRERCGGVGLHLVGHSFGARLVTAATAATAGGAGRPPLRPDSLTLLQAAYSHYGFARAYSDSRDGVFRRVVTDRLVQGPVLATHSVHDLAVGLAYPLASRLARQDASAVGDWHDRFGGMGSNGARKTPEAVDGRLLAGGEPYRWQGAAIHNLRADHVIKGHSDIVRPEVAHAVLSAVTSRALSTPPA